MPRALGDTNLSLREQRLKAENEILKVENNALKEKIKITQNIAKLRAKELKKRVGN